MLCVSDSAMKFILVLLVLTFAIQTGQAAVLWNPHTSDSNVGLFGAMKRFFDALVEMETEDVKAQERFRKCSKKFGGKPLLMALCTEDQRMDIFNYENHRGIN